MTITGESGAWNDSLNKPVGRLAIMLEYPWGVGLCGNGHEASCIFDPKFAVAKSNFYCCGRFGIVILDCPTEPTLLGLREPYEGTISYDMPQ